MCLIILEEIDVQVVDGFVHGFKTVRDNNKTGDREFQLVPGKNEADTSYDLQTAVGDVPYTSGFHVFLEREGAKSWIGPTNIWNEKIIRVRVPINKITATGMQGLMPVIVCSELYIDSFEDLLEEN